MSSWQKTLNLERSIVSDKPNKIRKRGSSSSSSSSLVRRYQFKRAVLVPKWNTRTKSPSLGTQPSKPLSSSVIIGKEKEISASARKLAATLWGVNDFNAEKVRSRKKEIRKQKAASSSKPYLSDSSYSPISDSEKMKGLEGDGCRRRASVASHKLQLSDYYLEGFDDINNVNFNEVGNQPRNSAYSKGRVRVQNSLNKARTGLSTSKKLLKALNQICLHEHHSSILPLISALGSELDQVCNQVDQVIQEQSSKQDDIEYLMEHFAEEKATWKRREQGKVRDAISRMMEEIEVEKKLRRQTERLNKKIAQEMADIKASHLKISQELETERKARETLEHISDELANCIGEDRAKVEELKRESAKVRDEVEKEREMLQFADVLREERVQMKLSEARYQFEEKNAVFEKLRNELEAFLKNNDHETNNVSSLLKRIKDLGSYLNRSRWEAESTDKKVDIDVGGKGKEGDESSDDSDLHSIELSLDNNERSYKWSYACDDNDPGNELKSVSTDGIGRKSVSDRIQWGNICFNKNDDGGKAEAEAQISFLLEGDQLKQEAAGRLSKS